MVRHTALPPVHPLATLIASEGYRLEDVPKPIAKIDSEPPPGTPENLKPAYSAAVNAMRECTRLLLSLVFTERRPELAKQLAAGVRAAVDAAIETYKPVDMTFRAAPPNVIQEIINDAMKLVNAMPSDLGIDADFSLFAVEEVKPELFKDNIISRLRDQISRIITSNSIAAAAETGEASLQ